MDVVASLAVAWTVIYLLVRYAGTLRADRRTARVVSSTASGIGARPVPAPNSALGPHHSSMTVVFTIATVGFAVFTAWLMRRRTPSAS